MVVPDNNNDHIHEELIWRYPFTKEANSDWLGLNSMDLFIEKGVLVKCKLGDLILWDSRTVHGGLVLQPSEEFKNNKGKNELVRLAMRITMVPRSLASNPVLERRRKAFTDRIALIHWSREYNVSGMGKVA